MLPIDEHAVEIQAAMLGRILTANAMLLATAESCTGGLIAHLLTNVSGCSGWFAGGIVAYSNQIKTRVLDVPEALLAAHGAVSREAVLAMVQGARKLLDTRAALAVSGIAGPDGGTPGKPVGTVWMAWAVGDVQRSERFLFSGSRREIKRQTAAVAVDELLGMLQKL